MTILLDPHALLWFAKGDASLSSAARRLIEDPAETKLISMASVWEIAIKYNLGRLQLGLAFESFIEEGLAKTDAKLLHVELRHLTAVAGMAHHHRDPFDRLLVAQAITDGITLLSNDSELDAYGVDRRW